MMRFLLLLLFVGLIVADEHWFVFDQHQFPGFDTPLFTLTSLSLEKTNQSEEKNLSFTLSTYERSITIDITSGHANETMKRAEQSVKLNIERADLLYNTLNHLIFVALRQQTKLETYVNCKLIDSYILYSLTPINEDDSDHHENTSLKVTNLADGVEHFETTTDEYYHPQVFEKFGCKQKGPILPTDNKTTTIGRPLIRKMQHVIEKVQRRKQRARRHQNQPPSVASTSDTLTVIYKPTVNSMDDNTTSFYRTILNVAQFALQIRYYPKEHLFHIRFNNENRTQLVLYADKSTDLLNSRSTSSGSLFNNSLASTVLLFLHITPTMISCYVNCESTDQEFIIDSSYVQNIIRQTMQKSTVNQRYDQKSIMEYDRQSTLILFNRSIEQVAANFFCSKLEKKNEDLLPDKYALRKFSNALDMLVNSLDAPIYIEQVQTTPPPATTTQSISAVNIHSINGFGSLIAPSFNSDLNTVASELIEYDKSCLTDQDCSSNHSFLKCQNGHCLCPSRYFWSPNLRHCISCKDTSIGNRCFRLSNHKSTWYEANDYCKDETSSDDQQQEYTMKLASNLNRTDIDLLKQSLLHEDDGEQLDYFYWIGLTSQFDTRKLHKQGSRMKRSVPTTVFRWYDNGETAQLNVPDIWCAQTEHMNIATINNNELCVSLTSCGLYADDCQRNYRFLCEAV